MNMTNEQRRAAGTMVALLMVLAQAGRVAAQTEDSTPPPVVTVFPHPETTAWWLSGQLNVITQGHGSFQSPYEAEHSLRAMSERATSRVWTLYMGLQLAHRAELLVDVESAGGRGISDALGVAGFTNLDVVRNPDLGTAPYLARLMMRYTIALSGETVKSSRGPFGLAVEQPSRRLEFRAGKLSMADFFDVNVVGSDSHLQFMNWTIDNNGAYDYAADTRGYTYGVVAEYDAPRWSMRLAEALMPTVANGIDMDWDLTRARGENVELELRPVTGLTLRLLGYGNHANMGSYQEAVNAFLAGADARPNIEAHRKQGRVKEGLGANVEYISASGPRVFARTGWNEGKNESFAYTEVNNTIAIGGDVPGRGWNRPLDRVGVATVSNGLSPEHQAYLRLGGLGFLLGDGALTYARETIVEGYYTAQVWRGVFTSADGQYVLNPGYNRDRGPVFVGSLRLHVDF